jgi:hypothetical protein
VLVDPEILRAFASQVATASTAIREADVGNKVSTAADGLSVTRMGEVVRAAGDRYEVSDNDLADSLKGIF